MAKKKPAVAAEDLEACSNCRFFHMEDPKEDSGLCRRLPPQIVSTDEGEWTGFPMVMLTDWCGEWIRRSH